MTTMPVGGALTPEHPALAAPAADSRDRRGSPIPAPGMIAARIMELRRRRGLMIALVVVNIGLPALFLLIRVLLHIFAPRTSPPAGGETIFAVLAAGFLPTFGFITAVMVGCTAGSRDFSEGMFRHLVVTGRSRLALYLARIPAGLAILVPVVAIGYMVVCAVSVFAAPTFVDDWNVNIPPGLSQAGFETWSSERAVPVICNLYSGHIPASIPCNGTAFLSKSAITPARPAPPAVQALAVKTARQNYSGYARIVLGPSISLMVRTGLWIVLQVAVAFMLGLGLASLMGQRTGPVILLLALQFILTPIVAALAIPDLERSVVGMALARLEPSGLPVAAALPGVTGGVGGPGAPHTPESAAAAGFVILAWLVVWSVLGAWRMMTRDA